MQGSVSSLSRHWRQCPAYRWCIQPGSEGSGDTVTSKRVFPPEGRRTGRNDSAGVVSFFLPQAQRLLPAALPAGVSFSSTGGKNARPFLNTCKGAAPRGRQFSRPCWNGRVWPWAVPSLAGNSCAHHVHHPCNHAETVVYSLHISLLQMCKPN